MQGMFETENAGRGVTCFSKLTSTGWESLKSQFVISKQGRGGRRKIPYAFTEHDVLMLSSILNSQRTIQVNIRLMRIFNQIRTALIGNMDIRLEISEIKNALNKQGKQQQDQDKIILSKNLYIVFTAEVEWVKGYIQCSPTV